MTTSRGLTQFEHILLSLLEDEARTGYELKRHFRTTPSGVYEPSSGALYPALQRLESRGFLRAEQAPSGRRSRLLYRTTAKGRAATLSWLREPLDPVTVGRDLGLHLMRFVVMERRLSTDEVRAFLSSLVAALEAFVDNLELYMLTTSLPGRHPRLALEHGLAVHHASLAWARAAVNAVAHESDTTATARHDDGD